jgi:hypothetical protein
VKTEIETAWASHEDGRGEHAVEVTQLGSDGPALCGATPRFREACWEASALFNSGRCKRCQKHRRAPKRETPELAALVDGYMRARRCIIAAGYEDDLKWAESLQRIKPDARYVMLEGAWVILNSGFRFTVAQKLWPALRAAFHDFDPARVDESCLPAALKVLKHEGKLRAMVALASWLRSEGHERLVELADDPPRLTVIPFIGDVTCWHFAKVLGADVVKPDVHLVRAAHAAHRATPKRLCMAIRDEMRRTNEADGVNDRLAMIDTVLWRYGERMEGKLIGWPSWVDLWDGRA